MIIGLVALTLLGLWCFVPSLSAWRGKTAMMMTDWPRCTEPIRLWLVQAELDRQNALNAEIDRNSTDTRTMYRIEFFVPEDLLSSYFERPEYFHQLDATRFEVSGFLIANGATPQPGSSAILNTRRHSLVVINSGYNVRWIKMLMSPFFPTRYGKA